MKTGFSTIYLIAFLLTGSAAEPGPFTEFFPAGAFGRGDKGADYFIASWYAGHLHAFKEPSLRSPSQPHAELYRFTMLPTFNFPLTVRLRVAHDGSGVAVAKRLTGKGGYAPGNVDFERTHSVTQEKIEALRTSLAAQKFWQIPTEVERRGTDGSEYIFEAFRDGSYHVVTRNSPEDRDPYHALCVQLLRLGQLDETDAYLHDRPKSK